MIQKIALAALLLLIPATSFAEYIVVLRDGKRYKAAAKWQIVDGKAIVKLTNGTTLQLDPALIDAQASERATRSGLGDVRVIETQKSQPAKKAEEPEPSLGSMTKLRDRSAPAAPAQRQAEPSATPAGAIPQTVLNRFRNAYENVGFYDASIRATGADTLRVEVVAENERQVFNALSATALLMQKLPVAAGRAVREIELRLITARGGSAGRFLMTPEDAAALEARATTPQKWFVDKVIF